MITFKEYILESHLEYLYHGTGWDGLYKILKENTIRLSFSHGANAINNTYPFYLSASRSNKTKYTNYCTIVLDGRKIGDNNKIKTYDYWGRSFSSLDNYRDTEMEERIFSNSPTLSPADKYINSIHIFIDKEFEHYRLEYAFRYYIESDRLAKELKIPIYFYTDKEAYDQLRTSRAFDSVDDVMLEIEFEFGDDFDIDITDRKHYRQDYYKTMVDIYNNKIDESNPEIEKIERDFNQYLPFHEDDLITQIMNDFGTIEHTEFKQLISNIIKQNRLPHNDESIKKAISIIINKVKKNLL